MKKLVVTAALFLATTSAYAGNGCAHDLPRSNHSSSRPHYDSPHPRYNSSASTDDFNRRLAVLELRFAAFERQLGAPELRFTALTVQLVGIDRRFERRLAVLELRFAAPERQLVGIELRFAALELWFTTPRIRASFRPGSGRLRDRTARRSPGLRPRGAKARLAKRC